MMRTKIRRRPGLTLVLAVGTGALAGYLSLGYLRGLPAAAPARAEVARTLVVAGRDLPAGAVLRQEDLKTIEWRGSELPANYVASAEEVVGHGLLAPLSANEPLLTSKVAGEGAGGGLSILIPSGMRAVSVRVDDVVSVAGFVAPGTKVDVLATVTVPGEVGSTASRVILQNVQVLAAGQSVQPAVAAAGEAPEADRPTVITLLVTPREAEYLTLAAAEGRIQLALRNGGDAEVMSTPGAWLSALAGRTAFSAGAAPQRTVARTYPSAPRPGNIVEIYHGSTRTVATF